MKKKQIILGITLFAVFIFVFAYKLNFPIRSKSNKATPTYNSDASYTDEYSTDEKTPEQVIQELEALENPEIRGPLSAEIIGPEGEEFMMGQARFYKAELQNTMTNTYKETVCNWKFYVNENNEEVLYREQTVPAGGRNGCGFTSSFIDKRGKLRVELEVVLSDRKSGEILDTYIAEREYIVK